MLTIVVRRAGEEKRGEFRTSNAHHEERTKWTSLDDDKTTRGILRGILDAHNERTNSLLSFLCEKDFVFGEISEWLVARFADDSFPTAESTENDELLNVSGEIRSTVFGMAKLSFRFLSR